MFTGIIHGQGEVAALQRIHKETRLTLRPLYALHQLVQGESIAVNGACLTVESFSADSFTAYASAETMRLTNLGQLRPGSRVNMERALAVGDRLGGHLVSGHVDCQATVTRITEAGQSRRIRLTFPQEYGAEVIYKGSVTLDGISLTINDCGLTHLEVNVIPETWGVTTVGHWTEGSSVNMETDIIGKYVRHMLHPWTGTHGERRSDAQSDPGRIDEDFLKQHGFF